MAPVLPMAPAADAQNLYMQNTKRAMLRMAPTPPSPRTYRGGLPLCRVSGGAPTEPVVSVSYRLYTKAKQSYRSHMQHAIPYHATSPRPAPRHIQSSSCCHRETSLFPRGSTLTRHSRIPDNGRNALCRRSPFRQALTSALWQTTAGSHCRRCPFDSTSTVYCHRLSFPAH